MPDFGAYYTAAWLLRHGQAVFPWAEQVSQAREAGLPAAVAATAYRNPSYFAFGLVPLTYLPYRLAEFTWFTLLLAAIVYTAVLVARRFQSPFLWTIVLLLTFPPVTLGLAWGNAACLMPLALLLLTRASGPGHANAGDRVDSAGCAGADGRAGRTDRGGHAGRVAPLWILDLVGYSLIAGIKIFPLVWLWIPMLRRQARLLAVVVLAILGLWFLDSRLPHAVRASSERPFVQDSAWIFDPSNLRLGQPNVWALTLQLTQSTTFRYERRGLSVAKPLPALLPLDPATSRAVALLATLLAVFLSAAIAWRIHRRGGRDYALWLFAALLCASLPVTIYPYLAVVIPAAAHTLSSRSKAARYLSLAGIILIELGRFSDYLAAVAPSPWIGIHCGLLAVPLLAIAAVPAGRETGHARRLLR